MIQYGVAYFLRMLCIQASFSFAALREWSFEFLDILAWLMALRVIWAIFRGSKELRDTYNAEDRNFRALSTSHRALSGLVSVVVLYLLSVSFLFFVSCESKFL